MNARPNQAVANFLIGPDCSFLKTARMIIAPTAGSQVIMERRLFLIIYSSRIRLKTVYLQSGRGHAPALNLCLSYLRSRPLINGHGSAGACPLPDCAIET